MSVISMAEVAYVRRADVTAGDIASGNPALTPKKVELVTAGTPEAQTAVTTALKVIETYIPTEIVTLYVAILAATRVPNRTDNQPLEIAFYTFLAVTPIVIWLVYAAKCKGGGKKLPLSPRAWPVWEMTAATIAFAAWAFALPDNPFTGQGWYSSGLAAIFVLIVSTLLGLVAPLFQRTIPASDNNPQNPQK